jgi:putative transposase
LQVCAILDDSSKMIIAAREYVYCNKENTIGVMDELVRDYWDICPTKGAHIGSWKRIRRTSN